MRELFRRRMTPGTVSGTALSLAAAAAVFAVLSLAGPFIVFLAALAVGAGVVAYQRRSGR